MLSSFFYHHYHQSDGSSSHSSSSSIWSFNSGRSGKQKQENKKIEQVTDANGRRDGHAGCHDRLKFPLIGVVQIGNLFRISLFPLPIVVASARWGDVAAWRTLLVAFLLLTLLSGPLRASNYACLHGFTGLALGMCWKRKFSWVQSVPISALARTIGVFSSLAISSLVIRENVLRLMVQQVYALIDQICATLGATFVPNMTAILCVAFVFVILNSLSYTLILHLVYSIALVTATPDGNFSNAPLKVRRSLGLPSAFMQ